MEGINKELDNTIKREVIIKTAIVSAKKIVDKRRPETRTKIADLEESKKLEDDWMKDF